MKIKLVFLLLLIATPALAQHIPVKGNLGVKLSPAPTNAYGAIYSIAEIMPQSTAQNLDLQPGDLLLAMDGVPFDRQERIPEVIGKFVAGNEAQASVLRAGKRLELRGTIMPAPPLKQSHHDLMLLEVPFRQGYTRAYLTYPKGKGPFPTIYYLQGYPCQSINSHPQSPVLQLTSALVELGYAVFRVEKPGVGEYVNLLPCAEYSFDDEVEHAQNSLALLRQQPQVDVDNLYLLGHSLGGNIAPLIAKQKELAGVMVFGTLVKPWEDYLIDMAYYNQAQSEDALTVANQIEVLKAAVNKLYVQGISHTELTSGEKELLSTWHDYQEAGTAFSRDIEFWKDFRAHNYFEAWAHVEVPVLSLYGASDVHAISSLDAELIASVVNQHHAGNGTFMLVDSTNHLFAQVPSRAKEREYLHNGLAAQVAFTQFNHALPALLDEWIRSEKDKADNLLFKQASGLFPKDLTHMSSMDVVTQDMNGDGHGDLLIATEFGPNRLFLYEKGRWIDQPMPQLKEYIPPYKGEDSEDIAAADFDNDGDIDVFFVSEDTKHHELLLNDGKGNLTIADKQIPKQGQANAVLTYDFNQDGWVDILIGIRGQNELYINLKGKGFAEQTSRYWVSNEDHTQDLLLVDIDNDGDMDIVEGIEEGGNNLFLNEKGTFEEQSAWLPLPADIETRKVIAADVDQDGDQDLFYCNVGWNPAKNPQNQLLLNDGRGHFKNVTEWLPKDNATTLDAFIADINADGHMDILTTNFVNDTKVKVFLGKQEGDNYPFEIRENLLPFLSYYGGTSILPLTVEGETYIYFANFKSEDILIKRIAP